jgi:TRAP transporter TAXI family solute receptor
MTTPTGRHVRRAVAACASLALTAAALAGCSGGQDSWAADLPDELTIATGGTTGIYYGYGQALAEVLEDRYGIDVEVLETGGSVDNLHLLDDGAADVAFTAADALEDAVAGRGDFDAPVDVQALARVYDDFGHLVVPAGSDVEEIADLRGLRVSTGAPRSGTALITERVLAASGVDAADLQVSELGITESIDALRAGTIDAFFWSGGLRTPGLVELSQEVPLRLVPLEGVVDQLRVQHGDGYRHGVVPEGVYGSRADVETLAVPNVLVVPGGMSEDAAYGLVATLFAHRATLAGQVPSAALLDRTRSVYTTPVDLHAGALRYYRDTKV